MNSRATYIVRSGRAADHQHAQLVLRWTHQALTLALRACRRAGLAALAVSAAAAAAGDEINANTNQRNRIQAIELRSLLVQAIDSPTGQAQATLAGSEAQAITSRFKGSTPIFVDVSTLKRYRQAGCRRLRLALWQGGVALPGASAPQQRSVWFDMNYCRDGAPPASLVEDTP